MKTSMLYFKIYKLQDIHHLFPFISLKMALTLVFSLEIVTSNHNWLK